MIFVLPPPDSPSEDGCADDAIDGPPLGRRRRCRTQFSDAGLYRLEESFAADPYPDVTTREELARMLSVTEDRIQVFVLLVNGLYFTS